jgi:hypothetical protein
MEKRLNWENFSLISFGLIGVEVRGASGKAGWVGGN